MAASRKASKTPAKTTKRDAPGALFVRDEELVNELDAWAEKLNAANPDGPQWTRASLARAVLRRGLRERGAKGETP